MGGGGEPLPFFGWILLLERRSPLASEVSRSHQREGLILKDQRKQIFFFNSSPLCSILTGGKICCLQMFMYLKYLFLSIINNNTDCITASLGSQINNTLFNQTLFSFVWWVAARGCFLFTLSFNLQWYTLYAFMQYFMPCK